MKCEFLRSFGFFFLEPSRQTHQIHTIWVTKRRWHNIDCWGGKQFFLNRSIRLPRHCCWTRSANRAETNWATCRPDWEDVKRRVGRMHRRPTKERCCVRQRPSFAAVYPVRRRPQRPRQSWVTRDLPPTESNCYHSDRQTLGRTNTKNNIGKYIYVS